MKRKHVAAAMLVVGISLAVAGVGVIRQSSRRFWKEAQNSITLPDPRFDGRVSIEKTLLQRRSIRSFKDEMILLAELAQLLWAGQGISSKNGFRTAPSAGALYPLSTYVVAGNAEALEAGVYRYQPQHHSLSKIKGKDFRAELCAAAFGQAWVKQAPLSIVFSADYSVTSSRYGDRAARYVHMEVGHAAQNICLQAVALRLGTVVVGAFHGEQVEIVVGMPSKETALYIICVGKPS